MVNTHRITAVLRSSPRLSITIFSLMSDETTQPRGEDFRRLLTHLSHPLEHCREKRDLFFFFSTQSAPLAIHLHPPNIIAISFSCNNHPPSPEDSHPPPPVKETKTTSRSLLSDKGTKCILEALKHIYSTEMSDVPPHPSVPP